MSDEDESKSKASTRFQPGRSGNPAGRPKGSNSRASEKEFLDELIQIAGPNGKRRRISKRRALKHKLYSAAMKDDIAASKLLMLDEKRNGKAATKAALAEYKEQSAREMEQSGKEARRKLEAMAARIEQDRLNEQAHGLSRA